MWFVKNKEGQEQPKSNPKDVNPAGMSGSSFEDAARQFTEPPRAEETPGAVSERQGEKLIVKVEWAQGALEGCFYPLARLDHPAWALTEEESAKGAPTMQTFLQMVADKIAPAMLARVVNKYPEFADLVAMLGVLYYQKYRLVRSLKIRERTEAAKSKPATEILTPQEEGEKIHCDVCGNDFDTQREAFAHLPCTGKVQ